jgi:glycosyltransferase involved in cell wall biosynthesis
MHVVSLPHTQTTRRYLHCAYTQKVVKFCDMMTDGGHEVFLYSGEENEARCTEHVCCITEEERVGWFGEWDPNGLFGNIDWDPSSRWWQVMNGRAIGEIAKRMEDRDFLLLSSGWPQHVIADALKKSLLALEPFVGYEGIHLPFRVFESYAWMHHVYGLKQIRDGAAYDAVIPNFFDPKDFERYEEIPEEGEFLLFIGRLITRKGPHVAAAISERLGIPLVVAGPGASAVTDGMIVAPEVTVKAPGLSYAGPVGIERRSYLMSRAVATIVPTLYIEPFGGVAAESMMCGTPAITSDWGAFTEYVPEELRFRTLQEGCDAVQRVVAPDWHYGKDRVQEQAQAMFSLEAVRPKFERHLERMASLWDKGWYQ